MPTSPSRLEIDLCAALGKKTLPGPFLGAVTSALERYRVSKDRLQAFREGNEKTFEILEQIRKLHRTLKYTLATFDSPTAASSSVIYAFHDIYREIDLSLTVLDTEGTSINDVRGVRIDRLRLETLRNGVMTALEDDAHIRVGSARGPAARAIAVVLREADGIDGKPARLRHNISGSEWAKWRKDYHASRTDIFGPGPSPFPLTAAK